MQRTERIKAEDLFKLLHSIFTNGDVMVFEAYSEMEKEITRFETKDDLEAYVIKQQLQGVRNLNMAIFYPETGGICQITKIQLNPKHCNGKTFRFRIDGWGIIHLIIDFTKADKEVECRISVNSEKRAMNWESAIQDLASPTTWNWTIVESKARKLITALKKLSTN